MPGVPGAVGAAVGPLASDPLILFYTNFFRSPVTIDGADHGARGRFTTDRRRIAEADAVVFHIPNLREMGDARKYPGQQWVVWSFESWENHPAIADPAFMKHFDLTMTYETAADVWVPYLPSHSWWLETMNAVVPPKTSEAPLVLFQSSSINASGREQFVQELARHMATDSYGRFMNNRRVEGPDRGVATKLAVIGAYPFCLGLENSIVPDYVTEKMFDPMRAGSVPVYFGAPNAAEFVPEHSYIDASAYGGPRGLADYLRHLIETPEEYQAYFAWRRKPLPERLVARLAESETHWLRRLVDIVATRMEERGPRPKGKPSLPFGAASFIRTRVRRLRRTGRLY